MFKLSKKKICPNQFKNMRLSYVQNPTHLWQKMHDLPSPTACFQPY